MRRNGLSSKGESWKVKPPTIDLSAFFSGAGLDFFASSGRSRDPGGLVSNSETREIERQVEANDKASRLKGSRQKFLVDKIGEAKRFRASVLRRFGLERLKFSRRNVIVKEAVLP